jgi:orotate phosphoribosyltransferase
VNTGGNTTIEDRVAVATALLEIKAAHFFTDEPFRFTSGVLSPTYVDCRKVLSYPAQRTTIREAALRVVRALGADSFDCVAGGETAGIPYAAIVADHLDLPMVYVRKKPKGFGKGQQIEGSLAPGSRVLLIEDLMFDAGSKLAFKTALEDAGAAVGHLLCVFSYGTRAAEDKLGEANLSFTALTDWPTMLEVAEKSGYFSAVQGSVIRAFLDNPTGWKSPA